MFLILGFYCIGEKTDLSALNQKVINQIAAVKAPEIMATRD